MNKNNTNNAVNKGGTKHISSPPISDLPRHRFNPRSEKLHFSAMQTNNRAEAERLLGIAEKLLQNKDLNGARDFALLAQETEPLLEGSDQIMAVSDVLIAGDKRINNKNDWYAVLELESRRNDDVELIKRQYRRLALLLHPDKNKYAFADAAFKLVADAWAVLSDPLKKTPYDNESFAFSKVDPVAMRNEREKEDQNRSISRDNDSFAYSKVDLVAKEDRNHEISRNNESFAFSNADLDRNHEISRDKIPVRRGNGGSEVNIWTACPYCCNLYEYPRVYEGCCLRCGNCERAFQVVVIPTSSLPPIVPGKEAYYCCWTNFPIGFAIANSAKNTALPDLTPPEAQQKPPVEREPAAPAAGSTVTKKRGRPKKNPLP